MALINVAYEALSDPVSRLAYDQWIAQSERVQARGEHGQPGPGKAFAGGASEARPAPGPSSRRRQKSRSKPASGPAAYGMGPVMRHVAEHWYWYGLAGLAGVAIGISAIGEPDFSSPAPEPHASGSPAPEPFGVSVPAPVAFSTPPYARPAVAPDGQAWPSKGGYLKGYRILNADGLSTVTIDNGENHSDIFAKLVSLDGEQAVTVRTFFVPARKQFTLEKVRPGSYYIRHRDLASGRMARTGSFVLEQQSTPAGTRYSKVTIALYKFRDGNMRNYPVAEAEF